MKKLLYLLLTKLTSYSRAFVKTKPYLTMTLLLVLACHLCGIIYSQTHSSPILNPNRKKLIVTTKILPPDQTKPNLIAKDTKSAFTQGHAGHSHTTPPPVVKTIKKTPPTKKKTPPPAPTPSKKLADKIDPNTSKTKKLLSELQESIAKIELNRDNSLPAKTIVVPKPIAELKADAYEIQSDAVEEEGVFYRDILIHYLKDALHLPGYGTVKIKLTLEHQGYVDDLTIVSSDSEVNRLYLEKTLQELVFPPFTGDLSSKRSYTFSLTFCSDQ
jgi:outer membrane biosynthesis protein TonB